MYTIGPPKEGSHRDPYSIEYEYNLVREFERGMDNMRTNMQLAWKLATDYTSQKRVLTEVVGLSGSDAASILLVLSVSNLAVGMDKILTNVANGNSILKNLISNDADVVSTSYNSLQATDDGSGNLNLPGFQLNILDYLASKKELTDADMKLWIIIAISMALEQKVARDKEVQLSREMEELESDLDEAFDDDLSDLDEMIQEMEDFKVRRMPRERAQKRGRARKREVERAEMERAVREAVKADWVPSERPTMPA